MRGEWVGYPDDEIIWLNRTLLSEGRDRSLHRTPRCPGLRYVHHRWEVFSRDTTHPVYVAPFATGRTLDHRTVTATASYILPAVRSGLEAQPVRLEAGGWVIGVGRWVLPVCVDVPPAGRENPAISRDEEMLSTYDAGQASLADELAGAHAPDAAVKVARYFRRNPMARLAMAYYYRDYIRGEIAPQAVPMLDVVIALDLSGEGAVSEYKKELQRRIWNEPGHQRELGRFLLANGLISRSDLTRALQLAAENEACGRTGQARDRLRYKTRRPG